MSERSPATRRRLALTHVLPVASQSLLHFLFAAQVHKDVPWEGTVTKGRLQTLVGVSQEHPHCAGCLGNLSRKWGITPSGLSPPHPQPHLSLRAVLRPRGLVSQTKVLTTGGLQLPSGLTPPAPGPAPWPPMEGDEPRRKCVTSSEPERLSPWGLRHSPRVHKQAHGTVSWSTGPPIRNLTGPKPHERQSSRAKRQRRCNVVLSPGV